MMDETTKNDSFGCYVAFSQLAATTVFPNFISAFGLILGIKKKYKERKRIKKTFQNIEFFVAGGTEYDRLIDAANKSLIQKRKKKSK